MNEGMNENGELGHDSMFLTILTIWNNFYKSSSNGPILATLDPRYTNYRPNLGL